MSLFDALSAPSQYALGALSGDVGERRTGEDLTGDITSGILLEILADPLNLVGAGITGGGALVSKVVRRLDKFNEWNRATERIHEVQNAARLLDEDLVASTLGRQLDPRAVGADTAGFFSGASTGERKRSLLDVLLGDVRDMDVERSVFHHGTPKPFSDPHGNPMWDIEEATTGGGAKMAFKGQESSRGPGFYHSPREEVATAYSRGKPNKEGLTAGETATIRELLVGTADDLVESAFQLERAEDITPDEFARIEGMTESIRDGIITFEKGGVGKGAKRAAAINEDTMIGLNEALEGLTDLNNEVTYHRGGLSESMLGKVSEVTGVSPQKLTQDADSPLAAIHDTVEELLKAQTPEQGRVPTVYKSIIQSERPLDVRQGQKIPRGKAASIIESLENIDDVDLPPTGDVPAEMVEALLMKNRMRGGRKEWEVLKELGYDSLVHHHTKGPTAKAEDIMTWDPEKLFTGIRRRYRPTLGMRREEDTLRDVLATYLEAGQGLDSVDAARAVGGGLLGDVGMGGIRGMLGAYDEEEEL